jgi:nucleotide-binding universal stress UspA family protein
MKVLLPIDGAPCSIKAIDAVANQFRPATTEVRLVHVVEWPKSIPMHLALGEGPTAGADVLASRDRAFHEGEALVVRAAQRLQQAGFNTSQFVVPGEARESIIAAATDWHADLIVMGSHGWKGLDRLFLGSVSDAVVRRAPCSVEVVRDPDAAQSQRTSGNS